MNSPQGFVSFCGRQAGDKALARRLLSRLNAQPLDVWIYERPGAFLPPDGDVSGRLACQLERSSVVVFLVTEAAFSSGYVQEEVEHTLDLERRGVGPSLVLVLAPQGLRDRGWPEPFEALRSREAYEFDPAGEEPFEPVVQRTCTGLSIPYFAPDPVDPRLPLRRRLALEIGDRRPRSVRLDSGLFDDLIRAAQQVEQSHAQRDAAGALSGLERIIDLYSREYADREPYYPRIARGVVLATAQRFQEAAAEFERLIEAGGDLLDENAFGGLGAVRFAVGHVEEALGSYREAHRRCPVRDAAIAYNVLLCHVAIGEPMDRQLIDEVLGSEGEALLTRSSGELARLDWLRIVAYVHAGELEAARRIMGSQTMDQETPIDLVMALADELDRQAPSLGSALMCQVVELLEDRVEPEAAWEVLHPLARLSFRLGRLSPARRAFATLCRQHPEVLQFHVELAQCHWVKNKRRRARCVAGRGLRKTVPGTLGTSPLDEAYFTGFAKWMLGRTDGALQDFEFSGRGDQEWYGLVLREA